MEIEIPASRASADLRQSTGPKAADSDSHSRYAVSANSSPTALDLIELRLYRDSVKAGGIIDFDNDHCSCFRANN